MPGPSSSQEIELEYVPLTTPESELVALLRRVMEGIHQEVSETFAAAPHRGAETGGILLGRREGGRIIVDDFEPVPSQHDFGPSYRLSDADRESLRETLEWFRGQGRTGLSVLGFYRSHTLPDFGLAPEDEDLMRTDFAEGEDLVLLVRPSLMGMSADDFFIRRARHAAPAPPPKSPAMLWPPPRPRMGTEPERAPRRRWGWYIAATALGLAGGALGYLWLHPETGAARIAIAAPKPPAAPAPFGSPQPASGPAPSAPDLAGIHALLDRWTGALKKGDVQTAAQCYAPVVSTYFTRHDVTREAVRLSLQQSRSRYGHLDVYRLAGLGITPVSDTRAVATFHKRWQTSGRRKWSGEELERMTLVRNDGAWEISSEQTEPLR